MAIRSRKGPFTSLALMACLAIGGCSGGIPGLYRIPIQQGNVVTVEMLQELDLGMDKRKVKFILGTPLVIDAFHLDRWDYYYSYKPGHGDTVQQRASLYFENDRLVRIDAQMDSGIDFHTVTHATDKVLLVPRKQESQLFAAFTPAFIGRDKEERTQEAIARSLDSGFNERQPGSADTAGGAESEAGLEPVAAAADTIGAALEPAGAPSEIYAPNMPADLDSTGAWSVAGGAVTETVSAETASQSRYLEQLFAEFGSSETPASETPGAAPESESRPLVLQRRDPTLPTRD